MERELQIFKDTEFGAVRVYITEENEPLMYGNDVAVALGYANPKVAVTEHCKEAKKIYFAHQDWASTENANSLENQQVKVGGTYRSFIPEADVYRLIFGSKLPSAQKFQEWVFKVVLPSIRKNGGYMVGQEQEEDPEKIMAKALIYAQNRINEIESRNNALSSENNELRVRIGEMDRAIQKIAPQSACYRKFMDCGEYICSFRELGIKLQMNERRFREKLEEFGYVKPTRKRLEPMKKYSDKGMLILRTVEYQEGRFGEQMFFTPKGIDNIVETFVKRGVLAPDTLEIIKISKPSPKKTVNNNFGQKPINFD